MNRFNLKSLQLDVEALERFKKENRSIITTGRRGNNIPTAFPISDHHTIAISTDIEIELPVGKFDFQAN